MNISDTMQKAINGQIQKELYSSYLYLAMSAHFEGKNLSGFAHWMRKQAEEENVHAMRLYKYLANRGGRVLLEALDKPPADFGTPIKVFEQTLKHEKFITASINGLYEAAVKEKDYPSQLELQWFINEQVEEERNPEDILRELRIIGDNQQFLLMMDKKIGER